MPPKLHYYIRFLFGLTRWEMYGLMTLCALLIGLVFVREEWIGNRNEGRENRDKGLGVREEMVAEVLEVSDYDTAFLNKVTKVIKVNRVTRVNKVYGGRWRGSSNWRPMPEVHDGRGGMRPSNARRPMSSNARWLRLSKPHAIDINSADSLTWIGLKGIGPAFAHRILLFREKLGGFHEVNQLKEVYGLDSLWVKEHKALLHVGKGIYRKFRLNSLEWAAFRHPYLSYAQAKVVLQYRKQHGPFKDLEALQSVALFDLKQWKRIIPYLDFE